MQSIMTFQIRPARPADQQTIRRIVRSARLGPFGLDWPNFLVAERAGEIVGVGQVKAHRDGSRELASLAVLPGNQGQGIGTALIQALLDHEEGVLFLFCGSRLRGYYQRFGFEEVAPDLLSSSIRRLLRLANAGAWLLSQLTTRRLRIIAMRREPETRV
jgi:N-acetylglutamate synthase-like GNAT family acetyltransferase